MQDGLEGDSIVLLFPDGLSCFQPVSLTQNTQFLRRTLYFNPATLGVQSIVCMSVREEIRGLFWWMLDVCVSRKYLLTVASIHDGPKINIWRTSHCSEPWPSFSFFPQLK